MLKARLLRRSADWFEEAEQGDAVLQRSRDKHWGRCCALESEHIYLPVAEVCTKSKAQHMPETISKWCASTISFLISGGRPRSLHGSSSMFEIDLRLVCRLWSAGSIMELVVG